MAIGFNADHGKKIDNLNVGLEQVSSQLANKATNLDLQIQTSRIDSFTTLVEGSTTGDAELISARIGADGVTYGNLGEAVRTQLNHKADEYIIDSNAVYENLSSMVELKDINITSIDNTIPTTFTNATLSISAGTYLMYVDFNINSYINAINCQFVPFIRNTNGSSIIIDYNDNLAKAPKLQDLTSYSNIEAYGIITVPSDLTNRPLGLNLSGTGTTNKTFNIDINKLVLIKRDTIDADIIKSIQYSDGKLPSIIGSKKYTKKYVELSNVEDIIKSVIDYSIEELEADCWGDSLTYGAGSGVNGIGGGYVSRLKNRLGVKWTVNNYGVYGETSRTIACRQGGLSFIVNNFTIPVNITPMEINIIGSDGGIIQSRNPDLGGINPCSINGIEGTITTNIDYTRTFFTRKTTGEAVKIKRPTPIITKASKNKGNLLIIWMGQNGGYDNNYETLVRQYNQMIDFASATKYIIIGSHTGSYGTNNGIDDRKELESSMEKAFGKHYINLRKYMSTPIYNTSGTTIISSYGLEDAGLTATADDLKYLGWGAIPLDSLTVDKVHFNDKGYDIVEDLVYKKGEELLYW